MPHETIVQPLFYNKLMSISAPSRLRCRSSLVALLCATTLWGGAACAQIVEVGNGGPGPVKAEHLTAELTSLSPQVSAGGTVQLGLVLTIEEHWHVYWVNAGDSGEPPRVRWTLPKGVTVGPMQFPAPHRLPLGPLMDFGYEDQVAFPMLLSVTPSSKPGKIHLDAKVDWLVCSSVCLPGKAHLGLDLDVVRGPLPEPQRVGALGAAVANLPKPLPPGMSATAIGDSKRILITLKTGSNEQDAEFYPNDPDQIANAAEQQLESLPDGIKISLLRAADPNNSSSTPKAGSLPKTLHGLVELSASEAYDITVPVTAGTLPPMGSAAKSRSDSATDVTALGAIGLALLGGLLLNLMPCVFPVLFLKGLALVNSSNEERGRQRVHGLIYTLGILISFWAIVGVLLIVRAGGREIGWGFQLQSPGFVAVLAALVFFLGLSLAGQFELGLTLTSAGGGLAQKQGFAGSFFTGVLATVVATPCMGPLMGAAVGFALAQPAWLTFTVFTALALGLALPYLALSMQPQWTRLLPRPGAWMETLKQLTAVPLFGTAIWLVWVYTQLLSGPNGGQDGVDRMASLLSCFLVLAIAGWVLGKWPARWKATLVAVLLIIGALALPLHTPAVETTTWQPYSETSLAAARDSGKPVFLDFTAAWCLSCKVNEAAVLRSKEVEASLAKHQVVLLKADWTQYDPKITQLLASLGRSGVPTYVIYPPGKVSNADVLPELLTKDVVVKAIEKDSKAIGQN